MINFKRKKIAVLELSGQWVKFLLGPPGNARRIDDFSFQEIRTNTNQGLSGGIMRVDYFIKNVLPSINICLEKSKGYQVYCVATAWAREAKNLEDIQKLLPVKIHVLSGEEESKMALLGYIRTAKRNLKNYDYLVSFDFGSKSTEIRVQGKGKSDGISLLNDSPTSSVQDRVRKKFGWLKDTPRVLMITTGRKFLKSTGYNTIKDQHDVLLDPQELKWHRMLQIILEVLGNNHDLVTNAASLAYGVWFKESLGDNVTKLFSL